MTSVPAERAPLALASPPGTAAGFPSRPGTVGSAVGLSSGGTARAPVSASPTSSRSFWSRSWPLGVWAAGESERALGVTDPGAVVIDEVMGMGLTMVGAPLSWPAALAGFLLFRMFDIVKPPPARALERLHGGWGIMADDFAAAIYAWAALTGWSAWRPPWLS